MIRWGHTKTPIMDSIERWAFRLGLVLIFLAAASFVSFVAAWFHLRYPL